MNQTFTKAIAHVKKIMYFTELRIDKHYNSCGHRAKHKRGNTSGNQQPLNITHRLMHAFPVASRRA